MAAGDLPSLSAISLAVNPSLVSARAFGESLAFETNVTLPKGSEIIQIVSNESFTIQDNTITFTTPVDNLAIQFNPPNIQIVNSTLARTVVGQGYSNNLNVTMLNQGTRLQNVEITICANASKVDEKSVALENNTSTTLNIIWNTAGLSLGKYTIFAIAAPISGETNIMDNNSTSGQVIVTIPGDVNGDFTVEIYDAITLAGAYNSHVGSLNWNPNADINNDGMVDLYDAIILAGHFNQHYS